MIKKIAPIFLTILLVFVSERLFSQQPSGIVVHSDYKELSNINLVWNILIFGVIPILLVTIYLIFKKKH